MIKALRIPLILVLICFSTPGCNMGMTKLDLGLNAVTHATPRYKPGAVKPPHLRDGKRRPPLMVIPGLKNLALYKPVTSSAKPTIGELEQINDGIKKSGEFNIVEGPSWVQVDLGAQVSIHAIAVWHFYKTPIIYNDVIVRVSDGADFSRNVRVLFNNDHDNSAGLGKGEDTAFISRWCGEVVDAPTRSCGNDGKIRSPPYGQRRRGREPQVRGGRRVRNEDREEGRSRVRAPLVIRANPLPRGRLDHIIFLGKKT